MAPVGWSAAWMVFERNDSLPPRPFLLRPFSLHAAARDCLFCHLVNESFGGTARRVTRDKTVYNYDKITKQSTNQTPGRRRRRAVFFFGNFYPLIRCFRARHRCSSPPALSAPGILVLLAPRLTGALGFFSSYVENVRKARAHLD